MKKRNLYTIVLLVLCILAGCSEKETIDVTSKSYKKLYESNLSEVKKLKNEINELKNTNMDLLTELNRYNETEEKIKKLENKICELELIIENKNVNTKNNESFDIPSSDELRKKVYEASKIYQDYFFLSHLQHQDDVARAQSNIYQIDGKDNEE